MKLRFTNHGTDGSGKHNNEKRHKKSTGPIKPIQSDLSKRWVSECLDKGRCSKLEAIYRVQNEAEKGKDVSGSMKYLGELIRDSDIEISVSAAYAAGACVAKGADPLTVQPSLISMLHSNNDLVVETAIDSLGECVKNPNHLARKILLNKLKAIEKNGVSTQIKANAGFALAEAVNNAQELVFDRELRRELVSAFSTLLKSNDTFCNLAGVTGFGTMAIASTRNSNGVKNVPESSVFIDSMIKELGAEFETEVILKTIRICALEQEYKIQENILAGAALYIIKSADEELIRRGALVSEFALSNPESRLKVMNLLMPWAIMAHKILERNSIASKFKGYFEEDKPSKEFMMKVGGLGNSFFTPLELEAISKISDPDERFLRSAQILRGAILSETQIYLVNLKKDLIESIAEKAARLSEAEGKKMYLVGNDSNIKMKRDS